MAYVAVYTTALMESAHHFVKIGAVHCRTFEMMGSYSSVSSQLCCFPCAHSVKAAGKDGLNT